ncbi:hypothetical protein Tco_1042741 [Tanacetum coccineum]|uniref:Retroviral polymerase SH3-like domain-containing protein n=1 Tax=Tanacetum coccineum TaxID=301880 RepID=A0ABQ5GLC5_9ASTR
MTTAEKRAVVNTGKGKMDNALKKSRLLLAHKTGNKAYLLDYEDYNGGFMAFGSDPKGGKLSSISFMRPFGCPLTILNTLDPLCKFDGKSDEGYLLGYSTTSKAFRVYNKRTKRVKENMHIDFLEDQPNVAGSGPDWMYTRTYVAGSSENDTELPGKHTAIHYTPYVK